MSDRSSKLDTADLMRLGITDVPLGLTRGNLKRFWPLFKRQFIQLAALSGRNEFTGGVLASILPAADFQARFMLAPAAVIPANPGVFNLGDNPDVWKSEREVYLRYADQLHQVTLVWKSILHDSLFTSIADPFLGLGMVSLQLQYAHIDTTEGTTDPLMLAALEELLDTAQSNQDLLVVLQRNEEYFHLRSTMLAVVSEYDKVHLLIKQWAVHAIFGERVLEFRRNHPNPPRIPAVAGDQTYDGLKNVLVAEYYLSQHPVVPDHLALSVTSAAPAAAMPTGISADSRDSRIDALTTQVTALAALMANAASAAGAAPQPRAKPTDVWLYCHSHGLTPADSKGHDSRHCTHPFAGHREEATAQNQVA